MPPRRMVTGSRGVTADLGIVNKDGAKSPQSNVIPARARTSPRFSITYILSTAMDQTTRTLADYTAQLTYDRLSKSAVHELKRRLIDGIACALGGYSSEPAEIARRV